VRWRLPRVLCVECVLAVIGMCIVVVHRALCIQ
jgi:hypothetical protein